MAFKLKSPFSPIFQVQKVDGNLGPGGLNSKRQSSSKTPIGIFSDKLNLNSNTEGEEENKIEEPSNETTKKLAERGEKGVPVSLNPKQKAKRAVEEFRKGEKDEDKFKKQTEKAKNIYKRNEFEELQNLDKKGHIIPEGEEGAGTTYYNPDAAEQEKNKRTKASQDRLEKATLDAGAATTASNISSRNLDEKIKELNSSFNMEGNIKPNRAGTPVRMLKSMEDKTPMKYKSARKSTKQNLMSSLAKKGEPVKGDFTYEPGSHYDKKDFGTSNINLKTGKSKPKKKMKNLKPSSHETRHTSIKF
jgi:hypothetical protein